MSVQSKIRSKMMGLMSSGGFANWQRTKARYLRLLRVESPKLFYFHQVEDPYSHMMRSGWQRFRRNTTYLSWLMWWVPQKIHLRVTQQSSPPGYCRMLTPLPVTSILSLVARNWFPRRKLIRQMRCCCREWRRKISPPQRPMLATNCGAVNLAVIERRA